MDRRKSREDSREILNLCVLLGALILSVAFLRQWICG